MLVVTLIHWDKFNHGDAPFFAAFAFYAWVLIYVSAPVVVTAFWLWNRAPIQAGRRRVSPSSRRVSGWPPA